MNSQGKKLTSQTSGPGIVFRLTVPASILVLTAIVVAVMIRTTPKPTSTTRGERAAIVDTIELAKSAEQVMLHITGTVTPSREITLQPRVPGEITWIDPRFIPGGRFNKGEVLLKIDHADYQIAVTNRIAGLAQAELDLKTEQGLQDIASYEWSVLQKMDEKKEFSDLELELSLRKPHLLLTQSNLRAAQAQVQQAQLNLDRATVRAPFNCALRSRNVNVGSLVSTQTALADLSGTDSVWVMATLPVSSLQWIKAADETGNRGSRAIVSSVPGIDLNAEWEGHVLRKMVDLEDAGKQAQMIVELSDPNRPLSGKGTILLGSYVRLTLEGAVIEDVYKIPSACLHGGGEIWIMSSDSRLDVRSVETKWAGREYAFLCAGVEQGEKLIVSDLGTPIHDMLLQEMPDKNADSKSPEIR